MAQSTVVGQTVLIIDDEPSVRELLARLLLSRGYTIAEASSGEEALSLATQRPFSAALVDISMPGISGLEVLRHFTDEYPDIAVIMVTAVFDLATAIESMKLGAHDYIVKPFTMHDVLERLAQAIRKAEIHAIGEHYQRDLERRVKDKTVQLRTQFAELSQALAWEHEMLSNPRVTETMKDVQRGPKVALSLNSRQQSPVGNGFKSALLRVLRWPKQ